ncbi:hypothetical protein NDU88_000587 [Pleurodeles waltl]|uniref:Uncharacterized protein n=1 Tax=Pleurodeles waltl TaxID=8319 RepID=A0AAV7TH76_PLEWA|nr:hypothetical protein NDU88_000587 [Pleurodeles waltl]
MGRHVYCDAPGPRTGPDAYILSQPRSEVPKIEVRWSEDIRPRWGPPRFSFNVCFARDRPDCSAAAAT